MTKLQWNNSTLLDGDVVSAITDLKAEPGADLQVIGSGNLVQTPQSASLIDEFTDEFDATGLQAGDDIVDVFDGKRDMPEPWGVRRRVLVAASCRGRMELRQLESSVAVRGSARSSTTMPTCFIR